MSESLGLGKIIPDGVEQHRDAIHIAVAPVIASEKLFPGMEVGFVDGSNERVTYRTEKRIGIIDPFLTGPVQPDQRCWLYLYPGSITSLRHEWSHPAFEGEETKPDYTDLVAKSRAWLEEFAKSYGETYEDIIQHAEDYLESNTYWVEEGRFEGESLPDEFWEHYEKATGKEAPSEDRGNFFSCACN